MRWLRSLFVPQQVRDCRFALDVLSRRLDQEWAWADVRTSVERALVKEQETVRTRMILDGETAADVVEDMIAITCLNDIEIGHHHIYRGVLDQVGQSKRNIFAQVTTEQLRRGRISLQEVGVANENMKRAVKEAG